MMPVGWFRFVPYNAYYVFRNIVNLDLPNDRYSRDRRGREIRTKTPTKQLLGNEALRHPTLDEGVANIDNRVIHERHNQGRTFLRKSQIKALGYLPDPT